MHPRNDETRREVDLWRRYVRTQSGSPPTPSVDDNTIAAYVDGMASAEDSETVELAMASDARVFELVRDLRALREGGPIAAPQSLVQDVKSAVAADRASPALASKLVRLAVWRRLATAAALVAFSVAGFRAGQTHAELRAQADTMIVNRFATSLGVGQEESNVGWPNGLAARDAAIPARPERSMRHGLVGTVSRALVRGNGLALTTVPLLLPIPGVAARPRIEDLSGEGARA